MKLQDFDYNLPKNLIAQEPARPRDHSRLLVLERKTGRIKHKCFYSIIDYLQAGDVLVLNNTKVFPARLIGKKKETKGKIEVLLHHKIRGGLWQCLLGGHVRKSGLEIEFGCGLACKVVEDNRDGTWAMKFNMSSSELMKVVNKIGLTPLPPYIKKDQENKKTRKQESKDYQTVYADDKKVGSVAAPTAGFHFTPRLIKKLKNKGVQFEYITLHVGLGTFAPVKVDNIIKHKMHAEWVEVKKGVMERIIKAKRERRRIIAVGTTSVRTLEVIFSNNTYKRFLVAGAPRNDKIKKIKNQKSKIKNYSGWVDIFIYPGFKFKVVDALITNFHLPRSTLLMLVMAFVSTSPFPDMGRGIIDKVYNEAIKRNYRFYSYGDAMFIY
jgi:S-adenosylmethionine:tRNA ribosyltransferase-isomerase